MMEAVREDTDWGAQTDAQRSRASAAAVLRQLIGADNSSPVQQVELEADIPAPWTLVAIDPQGDDDATQPIATMLTVSQIPCIVAPIDGIVVAFASATQAADIADAVLRAEDHVDCAVALSLAFDNLNDAPQQYRLVQHCLATGAVGDITDSRDMALDFIKDEIRHNVSLVGLLHPALATLKEYDEANQSNMFETLRVYLENDRNAQRCASLLYLHRNSLQYRIRRIQEIAGIDLSNPTERTWLRLSFFMVS